MRQKGDAAFRAAAIEPREAIRQRNLLLAGRGTGVGAAYQPFLQIERSGFQSRGRSHLFFDPRSGRQYHLLSDLELLVFIWAWSLQLADCREQYPLALHDFDPLFPHLAGKTRGTLRIAANLGIKHPAITKTAPRLLTTDLLLIFSDRSKIAVHAKYLKDLEYATARARELRKLEHAYWRERGVRFLIASEQPFTSQVANKMMWALDGMRFVPGEDFERFLTLLDAQSATTPLYERLSRVADKMSWTSKEAIRGFKFALLTRLWRARDQHQHLVLTVPWPGATVRNHNTRQAKTARLSLS